MRHFSKLFFFLLAFTLAGSANAQLSAGDIAFVSFDSDTPDAFSFLALTTIPSGTVIKFTDNGWQASGSFRANEGIWAVEFTSEVACGTEIMVCLAKGATDLQANPVGVITTSGSLALSASGDQILAYQGDEATPSFVAAINFEGSSWQADATSAATSALPSGLTDGMTAVAVAEIDNAQYSCITESGTKGDLLMAINDAANWLGSDNTLQAPAGCLFNLSDCSSGPGTGGGGDCAELFISEYVEGSGFEKYIEIYNPTPNPVDLAMYELRLYSNGAASPSTISNLGQGGVLQSGAVAVFKNSQATADGVVIGAVNHNGDDAFELFNLATQSTADIFGVLGNDPGSAWTAPGYSTANMTLRRIASVKQGVTVNPTGTGPSAFTTLNTEWEAFAINAIDGLGFQIGDCVADPACLITSVVVNPTSGCNDDNTFSQDDDYFLADVTVTFNNPPGSGDLELYGPNGFITKKSVSSISGGQVVFSNVELPANALPVMVTASFNAETCSADGFAPAVYPCSLPNCTPVINELDYNNPGTDDREFVELYNPCSQAINLADYSVIFVNGSNGQIYGDFQLPSVMLGPGEFFVICGNGATTPNCDLDVSPNTNLIQNGDPDAVALLYVQAIADAVSYEGSTTGFTEGSGDGLSDPATPLRGIGRYVDGVDTGRNNADFSVQCITPGEPNVNSSEYCGLPDDFMVSNIGCNGFPNDAGFDDYSGTFYVSSSCAHLFGSQDQGTLVSKETCGDAEISARIINVNPSIGYAGITMQESDAPGARKMSIIRYSNGSKYVEYRPSPNAPYQLFWLPAYTIYADYVRITRLGDYFFAAVSFDGFRWMTIYQQYMGGMPNCLKSGMVVSSYLSGVSTQGTFENVVITGSGGTAPRPVAPATINSDEPVSFNVFPNPVVDELSVAIGNAQVEKATISILGLDGRELYRGVHNINGSTVNLQLSGLQMTAGMYILTVNTGEEVWTKRFVKANP
ncbi:MAG: lamin tail domain-containing protein [Phaeodactylibacter sp.]|nr:lamin tail domain-containing protein [Phaeodactylibacter sp.]